MADYDTETAAEIETVTAQLKNLKAMRASGVLITLHGSTSVTFQSVTQLNAAIAATARDLRRLKGVTRSVIYSYERNKGL